MWLYNISHAAVADGRTLFVRRAGEEELRHHCPIGGNAPPLNLKLGTWHLPNSELWTLNREPWLPPPKFWLLVSVTSGFWIICVQRNALMELCLIHLFKWLTLNYGAVTFSIKYLPMAKLKYTRHYLLIEDIDDRIRGTKVTFENYLNDITDGKRKEWVNLSKKIW